MGAFANSEDPDEMSLFVAFHQSLRGLLRLNRSSEKEIQYVFEIITCDLSIYTMDHSSSFIENYIGLKKVIRVMLINT